ncbi:Two-component sensor histidine kinase [Planctomycetales bacterium 10988]|nr:Two-component sensor histidine kinase [Planctomycetales bacterium 10988]
MNTPILLSLKETAEEGFDDRLQAGLDAWKTVKSWVEPRPQNLQQEIVAHLTGELHAVREELAYQNRQSELGLMVGQVAHEMRKHLLPLGLQLHHLRQQVIPTDAAKRSLQQLAAGLQALETLGSDLIYYLRQPEPRIHSQRLLAAIEPALQKLKPELEEHGIHVELDIASHLYASIDAEMIGRAISNLARNAIDAMPEGGELVITAYDQGDAIELEIADNGPGLELEIRPQVFDPFFTTKGQGLGLGLSVVAQIAEAHQGSINVMNCPEGGAAFTLRFPQAVPSIHRHAA